MGSLDGTLSCGAPEGASGGPAEVVVGGQGTYVRLASSNVGYDGGTEIFDFDVTVQNLLREAIGTPDGSTIDPDGIRVFFAEGPTATGGEGTITVLNADGTGTFTGSHQPFFTYGEILEQNEESAARNWQLGIPSPDGGR